MSDRLFDVDAVAPAQPSRAPKATEPPARPAQAASEAATDRKRGHRRRALARVRLRCEYRCGWTDGRPVRTALQGFDELMSCPRCKRRAAIVVAGFYRA